MRRFFLYARVSAACAGLLILVASGAFAAEAGLAGYWKLDQQPGEQVDDSSGNNNTGVLVNGPKWVEGVEGSALSFGGPKDYVEVPHSETINLGAANQSYTVSCWFCSSVMPGDPPDAHFLTKFASPYPFSFVQTASGGVQFRTYDGAVCSIAESGLDITDGNWHFLAGVRDGSTKRLMLYIDGLRVANAKDETQGNLNNESPLRMGSCLGDDFDGAIDEVKIYTQVLSRAEVHTLFTKPAPPAQGKRTAGKRTDEKRIPVKRAEGVPVMRQRAENWLPTIAPGRAVTCVRDGKIATLKNARMEAGVSLETGELTSLISGGSQLLAAPGDVNITDVAVGLEFTQMEGTVVDAATAQESSGTASISIKKQYAGGYAATLTYTLGDQALCLDAQLTTGNSQAREARIDFSLPALAKMTKLFWTREGAPFDLADPPTDLITYRKTESSDVTVLPALTAYDPVADIGLSFVAPFDLPKPRLQFRIDSLEKRLDISNARLRLARNAPARAAIYIVPHEGDWRPALAWMLKTYPLYFRPGTPGAIESPGCYWLGSPLEGRETLQGIRERGGKWFQIHSHFPFYGLYMPESDSWEVIVGLADQGKANLADWEADKAQGGYENSYALMREAIRLRQECGMQPLVYFQSFEAWEPYAEKYYRDDVARNRRGDPHAAWYHCNLMNPDPAFAWGMNIAAQIRKMPEEYPSLDGIFYDRDDYRDDDYAHDDGVSMDGGIPFYMLSFAQQQINDVITGVLRKNSMGIVTNGPTSVEVCKYIDGIMCETNGWAASLQYLGLARPMVLLPYFPGTNSYDKTPADTEEKLKVALTMGYFPSLTYGDVDCQRLDRIYQPLFALMKDREWVLNAHALTLPAGMRGNIFRSPEGYYMVTVVDFGKSQVTNDSPTQDVDVVVNVPDAEAMKFCCVISPGDPKPAALPFSREGTAIRVRIPVHLASSVVVLSPHEVSELHAKQYP